MLALVDETSPVSASRRSSRGTPHASLNRMVLDAISSAIYVADLDSGEILFANQRFLGDFGPLATGARVVDAEKSFPNAPSMAFPLGAIVDATGEPNGYAVGDFQSSNNNHWYRIRATAVRWEDGRLARLHEVIDWTERVESERFVRAQQERLLHTSRLLSIGEMGSTLAHELNQPLGAISNYLTGCLRRLRILGIDAQDVAEAIEQAKLQADHAAKVIARVRDFIRTREPRREHVSLADLIAEVVGLVGPEAEKCGVRTLVKRADDLPDVIVDRVMIEQVLLNLVKNAVEAMLESDPATREVCIEATRDYQGMVEVRVCDRGHGVSSQSREQMFSPFFTTKPDGMGMGLNICRSIVEFHGGQLRFANNQNGGSTFAFTLPIAEAA